MEQEHGRSEEDIMEVYEGVDEASELSCFSLV